MKQQRTRAKSVQLGNLENLFNADMIESLDYEYDTKENEPLIRQRAGINGSARSVFLVIFFKYCRTLQILQNFL